MSGLQQISGGDLTELMRLSWTLAIIINGGPIDDVDGQWPVSIEFKPAIADYGTWCCTLTIDYTKEKRGRGVSSHMGTVSSALDTVRKELTERLGNGYVRYRGDP